MFRKRPAPERGTKFNGARAGLVMGVALTLIGASALTVHVRAVQNRSDNERLTSEAWEAFRESKWSAAIAKADDCINRFGNTADRQEKQLEDGKSSPPPTGEVPDDEREVILRRGPLNDVATCFFIKGEAAERLKDLNQASQAYKQCTRYAYARAWDPKGWFWSPAEEATGRAARLEANPANR
jgi:hypothetical protein